MLQLVLPNISHKEQWEEMIEEWGKFETTPRAPNRLFCSQDFEEFL